MANRVTGTETDKTMRLTGGALLYVSLKGWFGQRTEKTDNEQVDRLVKMLPPAYFTEVKEVQAEAYRAARPFTLSFPIRGVRFVPEGKIQQVEGILQNLKARYAAAADRLVENYEKAKAEARLNLGDRFNEANYPSADALRDCYSMTYTVFSVDASDAVLQSALGVTDLLAQFQQDAYDSLVSQFREALSQMVERLEDGENGKARRFRSSAIEGFQQFVADFSDLASAIRRDSAQGATMDEVEKLAKAAHNLVNGVTADNLREDSNLRATVQRELAGVSQTLLNMTVEAGSRNLLVD